MLIGLHQPKGRESLTPRLRSREVENHFVTDQGLVQRRRYVSHVTRLPSTSINQYTAAVYIELKVCGCGGEGEAEGRIGVMLHYLEARK